MARVVARSTIAERSAIPSAGTGLFCMYTLQPDRKMLVSAVQAVQATPEQHVCMRRHNQKGII
jgi:hypothetical protein